MGGLRLTGGARTRARCVVRGRERRNINDHAPPIWLGLPRPIPSSSSSLFLSFLSPTPFSQLSPEFRSIYAYFQLHFQASIEIQAVCLDNAHSGHPSVPYGPLLEFPFLNSRFSQVHSWRPISCRWALISFPCALVPASTLRLARVHRIVSLQSFFRTHFSTYFGLDCIAALLLK